MPVDLDRVLYSGHPTRHTWPTHRHKASIARGRVARERRLRKLERRAARRQRR